jgi:hypothetical protein
MSKGRIIETGDANCVVSPIRRPLRMSSPFRALSECLENGLVSRTVWSVLRDRSPSDSGEPHTGQVTQLFMTTLCASAARCSSQHEWQNWLGLPEQTNGVNSVGSCA